MNSLVLGPVQGYLREALSKVAALHAKKQFTFAIILGDLFENEDEVTALVDGTIHFPLTTYFTIGMNVLPERIVNKIRTGEEITSNLFFLPTPSIIKTADGIRIVALGGSFDPDVIGRSKDICHPTHTADDVKALIDSAHGVDILLTAVWPDSIWLGSGAQLDKNKATTAIFHSSEHLANLCTMVRPTYILSPSHGNFFFERTPFYYKFPIENTSDFRVSRFISLAPFNNFAKAKALYAFQLPATMPSIKDTTPSPFFVEREQKNMSFDAKDNSIKYSSSCSSCVNSWQPQYGRDSKHNYRKSLTPKECFFCLGNCAIGEHMVISVGKMSYLATAKGPLPTSSTFANQGINCPAHILIIPTEHGNSVATMRGDSTAIFQEMTNYRKQLSSMVCHVSRRQVGAVTWEISLGTQVHVHWQFLPVSASKVFKGYVEEAFRRELLEIGIEHKMKEVSGNLANAMIPFVGGNRDFLRIWLYAEIDDDGSKIFKKTFVVDLSPYLGSQSLGEKPMRRRFDYQYPRRAICKLMELQSRYDWRTCAQSFEDEKADAMRVTDLFKAWDFTLQNAYFD